MVEKMVVEGQMVEPGMKIYRLADLGLVWVQAQIYEQDLDYIKLGQEATMTLSYLPDREFRGRVTYIYPNVDEKTRTARVRMEFHNPGYFLKPGMFATVEVTSELEPSALLIPDMAILRSGEKNTVFVALGEGKFEPRAVALGPQAEHDTYQVLSGLKEGERIVTSGQFLLDSESQLREAIQKMRSAKESRSHHPRRPRGSRRRGHDRSGRGNRRRRRGNEHREIHLPDARTRFHRIRSPGQVPHLRHDAGAGVRGDACASFSLAASCSTTLVRCPSTATFTRPSRASAPSAA